MHPDQGILLYGPPASGKGAVTAELCGLRERYEFYRRLKAGGGRTNEYRLTTLEKLDTLQDRGELLYTNSRYGATYAVDRAEIESITRRGRVPVLHLGQVAGIDAVAMNYQARWLIVALWCCREQAAARLADRGDKDVNARLAAWDATLTDFRTADPNKFDLVLNTGRMPASNAAKVIASCCR